MYGFQFDRVEGHGGRPHAALGHGREPAEGPVPGEDYVYYISLSLYIYIYIERDIDR